MLKNFIYKNKYNISYGDYGSKNKNTLILFHGLLGSAKQNKLGISFEKEGIRLISIARFGYGDSDFYEIKNYLEFAKIVQELLLSLKIDSFNIFAISAGAPHAYALAFLNPKKVSKVFIYSGLAISYKKEVMKTYPKSSQEFYEMTKKSDIKSVGKILASMYEPYFTKELKELNEYKDSMKNEYQGMGQEAKLQAIFWGFDIERIKQQVYLQHSQDDEIVPFKSVKKSISFLKNPVLIELRNKNHYDDDSFNDFISFICKNFNKLT